MKYLVIPLGVLIIVVLAFFVTRLIFWLIDIEQAGARYKFPGEKRSKK